ncbi:MAG: hypothetical protein WC683_19680 [bacterium]
MARKVPEKGYFIVCEIEFMNHIDESFTVTPKSDKVRREFAGIHHCKVSSVKLEFVNCYDASEYESDFGFTSKDLEDMRSGWHVNKLVSRSTFDERFEQYYESETVYYGRKL